jgi:hypothetical protein
MPSRSERPIHHFAGEIIRYAGNAPSSPRRHGVLVEGGKRLMIPLKKTLKVLKTFRVLL